MLTLKEKIEMCALTSKLWGGKNVDARVQWTVLCEWVLAEEIRTCYSGPMLAAGTKIILSEQIKLTEFSFLKG